MRILVSIVLVAMGIAAVHAEDAGVPGDQTRLTLAEAGKIVRRHVFLVKPGMNPAAEFPIREEQVEGLHEKLGRQLFKVTDGVWSCASFLIGRDDVRVLGESFGGYGIMSACVSDLDGDGRVEFVYSYSWGSGIHRSHVAALTVGADGKLVETRVPFAFAGVADLFVKKLDDGTVRVEVGEFNDRVNAWKPLGTLGTLKAHGKREGLLVDVVLEARLPKEFRDAIWEQKCLLYWLDRPDTNEYVDLLLSRDPIEKLSSQELAAANPVSESRALMVTTYRKDSIWNIDGKPFKAVTSVTDFDATKHAVSINGVAYRFAEARLPDVVKLLEKPDGTIPIHRTHAPIEGAESLVFVLLGRLRRQANQ